MEDNSNLTYFVLLAMAALLILLSYSNRQLASPVLAIVSRWGRWIFFAFFVAFALQEFELSRRPFWVLGMTAFLSWFLIETVYNWIAISVLSRSNVPIFPKFVNNEDCDEWPIQKRFNKIASWLEEEGLRPVQTLKASIVQNILLRISIYEDEKALIRLQVLFVPQRSGNLAICFTLHSQTQSGARYVTDNVFLPFGGFYPKNWFLVRRPWSRSLKNLLQIHRLRIKKSGETFVPWEQDPLVELNAQQHTLEEINTELGFLFSHNLQQEHGTITPEGRYRLWKEVWMMNYLGFPVKS